MSEPSPPWTSEELNSDNLPKMEIYAFVQENASKKLLAQFSLSGQPKNIKKTKTKDQIIAAYNALFERKAFKTEAEKEEEKLAKATEQLSVEEKPKQEDAPKTEQPKAAVKQEPPKFTKHVIKKGDKLNFPSKGSEVDVFYTGKLQDGTIFDSNEVGLKRAKKHQPLKFKVGIGKVIKGWDQALLGMSAGERAEITIEPEWAYGKKGLEGKIPPNSTLIFEVELVRIY